MVARILAIFILLFSCPVFADEQPVTVEGSALIEGNLEKAKNDAFNDACELAIKNTLVKLYNEDAIKQNEWQLGKIYKQAKTFITGSQIISEKQNSEVDTYKVKLAVNVDENSLREFIAEKGISLSGEKILTILPLIVERTSSEGRGAFWWGKDETGLVSKRSFSDIEKGLSKYLAQGNFTLIDPYENQLSSNIPPTYRYMELKVPELVQLGKLFGTGLVTSGYVWTDCSKNDLLNKNICETTLSQQILSVDTGKVVAAKRATEKAEAADIGEARTVSRAKACQTVSDSLVYQMARRWDKRPATNFRIVIKGIKDFSSYMRIRNTLITGIAGLNNVVDRYQSKGYFVFEGDKRVNTTNVQTAILSKCFPGSTATVVGQDDAHIEISI